MPPVSLAICESTSRPFDLSKTGKRKLSGREMGLSQSDTFWFHQTLEEEGGEGHFSIGGDPQEDIFGKMESVVGNSFGGSVCHVGEKILRGDTVC